MHDLRYCKNCGHAASGYGFVAAVQGLSPSICPECKKPTLDPISKTKLAWQIAKDKLFKKKT